MQRRRCWALSWGPAARWLVLAAGPPGVPSRCSAGLLHIGAPQVLGCESRMCAMHWSSENQKTRLQMALLRLPGLVQKGAQSLRPQMGAWWVRVGDGASRRDPDPGLASSPRRAHCWPWGSQRVCCVPLGGPTIGVGPESLPKGHLLRGLGVCPRPPSSHCLVIVGPPPRTPIPD